MGSYFRDYYSPKASQRPVIGDTKMSIVALDHMGWLKCDGRTLSVSQYNLLFQSIGYTFGGSGNTFALPNMSGRVAGSIGQVASDDVGRTGAIRRLGDLSGEEVHLLNIKEMPAHNHGSADVTDNTNGNGVTGSTSLDLTQNPIVTAVSANNETKGINVAGTASVTTSLNVTTVDPSITPNPHNHSIGSTGGGAVHNNMQPTLFLGNTFIYCGKPAAGTYPYFASYPAAVGNILL